MRKFGWIFIGMLLGIFPAKADVPVSHNTATQNILPLRADSGLTVAEQQMTEGKYMQSLETLAGVLARRPTDADALAYAGQAWKYLGNIRKAAEYCEKAITADPRHLGANVCRAELYFEAGDTDRAMEQLQAVRLICAGTNCAELDRLQSVLNTPKKSSEMRD